MIPPVGSGENRTGNEGAAMTRNLVSRGPFLQVREGHDAVFSSDGRINSGKEAFS